MERAWRLVSLIERLVELALSPIFYLWPWVVAVVAYGGFVLLSAQGRALALDVASGEVRWYAVYIALAVTIGLVAGTVAFTSVAVNHSRSMARANPQRALVERILRHLKEDDEYRQSPAKTRSADAWLTWVHGVWVAVLATGPALLFGIASTSWFACILAALSLVGVLLSTWAISVSAEWDSATYSDETREEFPGILKIFLLAQLFAAIVPLLVGALVLTHWPTRFHTLGPLLVAMIGLLCLATLVGNLFIAIPATLDHPWLGAAVALVVLSVSALRDPRLDVPNPLLKERRMAQAQAMASCRAAPASAAQSTADRFPAERAPVQGGQGTAPSLASPLYVVSAEGGGARAAYWTGVGLAELDLATDGGFSSQVASLSGVSGGSLGIATWLGLRSLPEQSNMGRLDLAKEFLGSDFLSPLIGGLLFLDAPRAIFGFLWPSAHRDHVFELAVADRWLALAKNDFFARPLNRLCIPDEPFVAFNSTDAITGERVPLSNIAGGLNDRFTLVEAVHTSARFPFLSPGNELPYDFTQLIDNRNFQSNETKSRPTDELKREFGAGGIPFRDRILVDGGYVDNSGLATTEEYLGELTTAGFFASRFRVPVFVHFANDPEVACFPVSPDYLAHLSDHARRIQAAFSPRYPCTSQALQLESAVESRDFQLLTTPLATMLSVREHRGRTDARRVYSSPKTEFRQLSVADELTALLGPLDKDGKVPGYETPAGSAFVSSAAMSLQASGRFDLQRTQSESRFPLPPDAGDNLRSGLQRYRESVEGARQRLQSANDRASCMRSIDKVDVTPPLGWKLNARDQALLACLATVASLRANLFYEAGPPYPGILHARSLSH